MKNMEKSPINSAQYGVYLDCLMKPESVMYNLPFVLSLNGDTDFAKLSDAIRTVVDAHAGLSAVFVMENGEPAMCYKPQQIHIPVITAEDLQQAKADFVRPFDLEKGPLYRFELITCGKDKYLLFDIHHLLFDGFSLPVFMRDLAKAYAGENVETETFTLFDAARSEEGLSDGDAYKKAQEYFRDLLGGLEIAPALTGDADPDGEDKADKLVIRLPICPEETVGFTKSVGVTESAFFLGAFAYTLAKFENTSDCVFTTVTNGRGDDRVRNTVGMFVKTLPMHVDCRPELTTKDFLLNVRTSFKEARSHDCISFAELCHDYGITADVSFAYQSSILLVEFNGTMQLLEQIPRSQNQLGVSASLINSGDGYSLMLEWKTNVYSRALMENFAESYAQVVRQLSSVTTLNEISLLSEEQTSLLDSLNQTEVEYDDKQTVVLLFDDAARRFADRTAVVYENTRLTYAQLDDMTDRLAAYISSLGVGREDVVSVLINRSEYMAVASLGVLKAGAAYQPLDPSYPQERLNFMVKDAAAKLVIADENLLPLLTDYNGPVLLTKDIPALPAGKSNAKPLPEDLFVLLYTSGSTGVPKGVMLTHGNLTAFIHWHHRCFALNENEKMLTYASFGFDACMMDLFSSMTSGAMLFITPEEKRLDFDWIDRYVRENGIGYCFMTTQVARMFAVDRKGSTLKNLFMGGEKLVPFAPEGTCRYLNGYGPSECTACSTYYSVEKSEHDLPIGKPVDNLKVYVTDSNGKRLPPYAVGELCIAGPQVARGYLNRPEKTAEVFVKNPFCKNKSHERMYKSGDVVYMQADGNLRFVGRRDAQVKVRGFRIELTEVEGVIREFDGIKDVCVAAYDAPAGGKFIAAYVVSDSVVDVEALNAFIRSKKPSYIVPAVTVQIDAIPLTPNQKVDRKKLPPVSAGTTKKKSVGTEKRTELETVLCNMLCDLVGHNDFNVDTEFADAGISSITSIRLAGLIYKRFGLNISSKDILNGESILSVENRIVAYLLDKNNGTEEKDKEQLDRYPLTQSQIGIYTDCLKVGMNAYNVPMLYKLPKEIDEDKFKNAVVTAVKAHKSLLCYVYPDENGEVAVHPAPEMDVVIGEETLDAPKPEPTPFTFAKQPLFRIRMLHCGTDRYFFFEAHHIIFDGESFNVLAKDIDRAYRGEEPERETYTAFDMASDEKNERNGSAYSEAKKYYDSVFRGVSADYMPAPDRKGEKCKGVAVRPLAVAPSAVHDLCEKYRVTENVLFTGAFAVLLSRFTAHDDALFLTVYNGRNDPRTENVVGMLVKTLPVYTSAVGELKTADFLCSLKEHLQLLKKNDIYSFADAAHDYGIATDIMFIYQGRIIGKTLIDGKELESVSEDNESAKMELSVQVYLEDSGFKTIVEYNAGKYSEAWVDTFADAYETCVKNLLVSDTLGEVDITSEQSLSEFVAFNDTACDVPYRPVYRLLEERAQMHPDRVAVIADNTTLTYRQLDKMSNALAAELVKNGVKPYSPVAVMTDRTAEIYVAEYGILKAGCAYIFVSDTYPDERVMFIREDAGVKALVTTHAVAEKKKTLLASFNVPIVYADDVDRNTQAESLDIYVEPDALAYMIYTSGSTGTPKGVMVKQRGVVNLSYPDVHNSETIGWADGNTVSTAVSSFTFDASVMEGLIALNNGSTVCIASEKDIHNPDSYAKLCLDNRVNGIFGTPSFILSMLDSEKMNEVVRRLRVVMMGGEALSAGLYKKLRALNPTMLIINGYGPSEATVTCSCKYVTSADQITIGTPLANTKLYCVDKQNRILPMGALGELTVLGENVGAGYLNRDELTKKNFITLCGKPAYKTGDLALISHDGEVEFHGRIDNQVKIRGFRVELGEIENVINAVPGVNASVVVVKGDGENKHLVAYFTAQRTIDNAEMTAELSGKLTSYMVPHVIMQLDTLPMTANGKIDKKALPEPVMKKKQAVTLTVSATEKVVCDLFANILNLTEVLPSDNFYEIGGNSLSASRVVMQLKAQGYDLEYQDVFDYQTPGELASFLDKKKVDVRPTEQIDYASGDPTPKEYREILQYNTLAYADKAQRTPLGDVLLTGAVGFLGSHVLWELLEREEGHIYCLVRKGTFPDHVARLKAICFYYFGECPDDRHPGRVTVLDADITSENLASVLKDVSFDTVINCAASVKHYASDNSIEFVNVHGVENLITLAKEKNAKLIQISTTSIAGVHTEESLKNGVVLHENQFFTADDMNNQYIISKYHAEQRMMDAMKEGMRGKIIRVGNLMGRRRDGEFQINMNSNAFLNALKGFVKMGNSPVSHCTDYMEFSPIDCTARAIVALAGTSDIFTLFHANNRYSFDEMQLIEACNRCGLPIVPIDDKAYYEKYNRMMADPAVNRFLAALITNDRPDLHAVMTDNRFTANVLYRIGFTWPFIDSAYLEKIVAYLRDMGFFEREPS